MKSSATALSFPWAGLALGPSAWFVSTQANYALAPWQCAHGVYLVPWIATGLAVISLAAGAVSGIAWRAAVQREPGLGRSWDSESLIGGVGSMTGVLFALVILMQGFAGLVFGGCETPAG